MFTQINKLKRLQWIEDMRRFLGIKTSIYPIPPYFCAQNIHFRIHIILQHAFSYPRVQTLLP